MKERHKHNKLTKWNEISKMNHKIRKLLEQKREKKVFKSFRTRLKVA